MRINLKELPQGKKVIHTILKKEDLNIADYEKEFVLLGDVDVEAMFIKSKSTVNIKITAKYTLRLQCSRCLTWFDREYREQESFVFKEGKEKIQKEKSLSDEDIYTYFYMTEEVDLSPLIRDMIVLSVPMKPLCKEDCKGLCPVCGANWNEETCEHMGMTTKPTTKLSKLLEFKDKLYK